MIKNIKHKKSLSLSLSILIMIFLLLSQIPRVSADFGLPFDPFLPETPTCNGLEATISVETFGDNQVIFGGPDDGDVYEGTINGTEGDDVIVGTEDADIILSGAGNDTVCSLGNDDSIDGGNDSDYCDGGDGENTLLNCEFNEDGAIEAEEDVVVEEDEEIEGCTDELAENYDPEATVDDASCIYAEEEEVGGGDGGGGESEEEVEEVENVAPVITLLGNNTIKLNLGNTFIDPGYVATDNEDGDITESIVISGDTIDNKNVGDYIITYNVMDSASTSAEEKTRTVSVFSGASGSFTSGSIVNINSGGLILGISTGVCDLFLEKYLTAGQKDDIEQIVRLQVFLRAQGLLNFINGKFDIVTEDAVRKFQLIYKEEVLNPWVELGILEQDETTGDVHRTTRWKINNMMCRGAEPFPSLL